MSWIKHDLHSNYSYEWNLQVNRIRMYGNSRHWNTRTVPDSYLCLWFMWTQPQTCVLVYECTLTDSYILYGTLLIQGQNVWLAFQACQPWVCGQLNVSLVFRSSWFKSNVPNSENCLASSAKTIYARLAVKQQMTNKWIHNKLAWHESSQHATQIK